MIMNHDERINHPRARALVSHEKGSNGRVDRWKM